MSNLNSDRIRSALDNPKITQKVMACVYYLRHNGLNQEEVDALVHVMNLMHSATLGAVEQFFDKDAADMDIDAMIRAAVAKGAAKKD